jgi:5-methylthioadenosine/S-adenosylhomocysteine deaminase
MHLRDEYLGDPLVTMHFAPQCMQASSDATLARVRRLADELDVPVAMLLHETTLEVEQCLRDFGLRPLERLAGLGLVSPQLVAIHMTQAEPRDIDLLAGSGASIVHCPESNLRHGSGVCPVAALLGRGVRVALGTDGAAANNDLDLLTEARVAGLLSAGVAATPGDLAATDLLRMATLEGARTLGLGEVTGSLVPGKWADLCCLNLRAPRSWPVHDVPTAVIYAASSQQVTDTWVGGRRLLAESRLTLMDESAVLERAEAWRTRHDENADEETGDDD